MPLSGPNHNRLTRVIGDYLSCMLLCMCTYLLERAKEKKSMKTKQDKKKQLTTSDDKVPFYTIECMNGNSMRVDYPVRSATV